MSDVDWQAGLSAPPQQQPAQRQRMSSSLNIRMLIGVAVLFLGLGMFALGIFHGFEHGSCSSTGYSRNYGPVQRCAAGTGWWVLILTVGLFVSFGGGALAGVGGTFGAPLVFVAIGAPSIALGLGSGHERLLYNGSSSTGKTFVLIFGACFVISGVAWGVVMARRSGSSGMDPASGAGSLLAGALGLAVAFLIAGAISSAIGKTTAPASVQVAPGVTVLSAAAERAREIALCKSLIGSNTVLTARDRATLTAECTTNHAAALRDLRIAARRDGIARVIGICRQQIATLPPTLPASVKATLTAACSSAKNPQPGTGLQATQAAVCREVVKTLPPAAQAAGLASCPKP